MTNIFCDWTITNWISFAALVISIVSAILLFINFFIGQRQTKISLSINQFNIFFKELEDLIKDAQQLNFKKVNKDHFNQNIQNALDKSDAIDYLDLFCFVWTNDNSKDSINTFRNYVVFPLYRYNDKLLQYLTWVKNDTTLTEHYKKRLYNKIERDILQSYFRICNNGGQSKIYDLTQLNSPTFTETLFYKVNNFYIDNDVFQYKTLNFYTEIK